MEAHGLCRCVSPPGEEKEEPCPLCLHLTQGKLQGRQTAGQMVISSLVVAISTLIAHGDPSPLSSIKNYSDFIAIETEKSNSSALL